MTVFCVGLVCMICAADLILKEYVELHIDENDEKQVLESKVRIRKVYNKGMAFNVMDRFPKAVKRGTGAAAGILGIYELFLLMRKGRNIEKIGVSMMLGGALSNLYDRVVKHHVVDYIGIKCKHKKLSKLTFNIGDLFLAAGGVLAVTGSLFPKK